MENSLYFNKIKVEGVGSIISPVEVILDDTHLTHLRGPNGSGKSTIFQALFWAIYKDTLKKKSSIEPWPHIVDKLPKFNGTKVDLWFTKSGHEYQVTRMIGYKKKVEGFKGGSRVIIYEDGEPLNIRDKGDINKRIVDIVGISPSLFKHSVLMGQKLSRISSETGPTRKQLFTEIFETSFLQVAKDKAKAELDRLETKYNDIKVKLGIKETELKGKVELLGELLELSSNFDSDKAKEVKRIESMILDKRRKHSDLTKTIDRDKKPIKPTKPKKFNNSDIEEVKSNIASNLSDIKNLKSMSTELEKSITKLEAEKLKVKDVCEHCGTILDKGSNETIRKNIAKKVTRKKSKKLGISESLSKLYSSNSILESKLTKLETARDTYDSDLDAYDDAMDSYNNHDTYIENIKNIRSQLRKEINSLNKDLTRAKESKFNKVTKIKDIERHISLINRGIDIYNTDMLKTKVQINRVRWVINDPLSSKGISTMIFDNMLDLLNQRLSYYSKFTKLVVEFYITDSKKRDIEIDIEFNSNEVPMADLSGGQQQLVDASILFAINDVVSSSTPINILLLDEIFESLDIDNVEVIGNLISNKSKDHSIFLITHLKDFNILNTKVIDFKLVDGITEVS